MYNNIFHIYYFLQYLRIQSPFCPIWRSSRIPKCDIIHLLERHIHVMESKKSAILVCFDMGNPEDNHNWFHFLRRFLLELGNKSWKSQALASNQVVILDWFCYYSLAFWLNASHSSWHNPILDVFQLLACVQTDWPNRCPRHNKKTSVCGLVTGEMPGVPVDLSLQTISFSVFRRHVRTTVINFRFVFFWGKLWR